jgi:hypothetical protein
MRVFNETRQAQCNKLKIRASVAILTSGNVFGGIFFETRTAFPRQQTED